MRPAFLLVVWGENNISKSDTKNTIVKVVSLRTLSWKNVVT